ncbi:MAG: hypothetical protein KF724_08700 [Phycisphaeraceae bacterium]|nr:hypothetical protein [Phycisphaeraceae bacterium]
MERQPPTSSRKRQDAGVVLLVGELATMRLIAESLESEGLICTCLDDIDLARRHLLECHFDVALLDLDACGGRVYEVVQLAERISPSTLCMLRLQQATVATIVSAMRAGIGDCLVGTLSVPQLRQRIQAALRRSREASSRMERVTRLTNLCRSLVARRGDGDADLEALAALMQDQDAPTTASGEESLSEPSETDSADSLAPIDFDDVGGPDDATIRSIAFDEMASQHLDPEQLITASIEYLVGELGPVNAAIFLGTGSCRFGLAAYARADLPRVEVEEALRRWGDEVCPMAAADGRVQFMNDATLLLEPGLGAHRGAVIVPCRHEGICDAVFVVLAQSSTPIRRSASRELEAFASCFARQLQRIQRIHSRHRLSWPADPE